MKVNPEYEALLPKISNEEFVALRESIRNEGLHYAIAVNDVGVILDGHHRHEICKQLCITPRVVIKTFKDPLLEKKFVIESNLRRRHLGVLDKAKMAMELEKIESELAKQRQGIRTDLVKPDVTLSSNELEVTGQARDIAAEKVGLEPTTYFRAKTVLEKGTPELQQEVRNGEKTVSRAYNEIKQSEKPKVSPK